MTDFYGTTPVGRAVSLSIFQLSTGGKYQKDRPEYYIQVAIPKTAGAELDALFQNMQQAAAAGFFRGEQQSPGFAWKYKDGDAPENAGKEGWAGCYVFTFRTGFAPRAIVDMKHQRLMDPNSIKAGYQVRVAYSCKANGDGSKPGIFLNFDMVQLVSVDAEISSGPAPEQVFQSPAQALPLQPGATSTPPAPGYAPPAAPAPPVAPPAPTYQPPPLAQQVQQYQRPPVAPPAPAGQQYQQPVAPPAPVGQQYQQPVAPPAPVGQQYQQPVAPPAPVGQQYPPDPSFLQGPPGYKPPGT